MRVLDGLSRSKVPLRKFSVSYPPLKRAGLWLGGLAIIFGLLVFKPLVLGGQRTLAEGLLNIIPDGRYLILFQNNTELRATGGFLGSFGVLTWQNGRPIHLYIDTNIYKRDNQFIFVEGNCLTPPEPIVERWPGVCWAMRDSNWAVDFPTAAKQIAWFYQLTGGEPVQGVIALNARVMLEALRLSGPVELPAWQLTVTPENFYKEVQFQVEKAYFEDPKLLAVNEPKTILKDLLEALIAKVGETQHQGQLFDLFWLMMRQKEIMVFLKNPAGQKVVSFLGFDGAVDPANGDYLQVNWSNLGGNKSSLNLVTKYNYLIKRKTNNLEAQLIFNVSHLGTGAWPDGKNESWIRIIVPPEARLLTASLNNIALPVKEGKEAGKKVFGFWLKTPVGGHQTVKLTWTLPAKFADDYQLLVARQSGAPLDGWRVSKDGAVVFDGILSRDIKLR